MRWTLIAAGLLGVTGVAIGAFAAHGLEGWLEKQSVDPEAIHKRLQQCEVAVRYHLLHALALLAVGLGGGVRERLVRLASWFWLLGIMLFSGGLYSLVFLGAVGHWAIVPSGGFSFILGWSLIVLMGFHARQASDP